MTLFLVMLETVCVVILHLLGRLYNYQLLSVTTFVYITGILQCQFMFWFLVSYPEVGLHTCLFSRSTYRKFQGNFDRKFNWNFDGKFNGNLDRKFNRKFNKTCDGRREYEEVR